MRDAIGCGVSGGTMFEPITKLVAGATRQDPLPSLPDRVPAAFFEWGGLAKYLFAARWLKGIVCPGRGMTYAWRLQTKPRVLECPGCGDKTSVTGGPSMPAPSCRWPPGSGAACLMAIDSNGTSEPSDFGSHRSAQPPWGKHVAPDRSALSGMVEIDRNSPAAVRPIRSPVAVQAPAASPGHSADSLRPFIANSRSGRALRRCRRRSSCGSPPADGRALSGCIPANPARSRRDAGSPTPT
jgi:hypothetical protein